MDCPACALKIEKGLALLAGVERATVNLMGETVTIVHSPDLPGESQFRSTIVDLGYSVESRVRHTVLSVLDMDCPNCAKKITQAVLGLTGVESISANPVSGRVTVDHDVDVSLSTIESAIREVGYKVGESDADDESAAPWYRPWSWSSDRLTLISGILFGLGVVFSWVTVDLDLSVVGRTLPLSALFYLLAAVMGGFLIFPDGFRAARRLSLDMNFLMSIAVLGAAVIGEYMEAAAIAFLFSLAERLEERAIHRARRSIESLMSLAPDRANVRRDGVEVAVSVDELLLDEVVLIRPGEKIPIDAEVIEGESAVDQSTITGESMPVARTDGDPVFAGTMNGEGYLEVRVTRVSSDTKLSQIVRMVQEAEEHKAPIEQFVKRFASIYTPAVSLAALGVILVPTIFFGGSFDDWFIRGLALLVIACPCAMVISTPVAVVSAITSAARNGVLIRGGEHLEMISKVKVVAFDKTGTLTKGAPEVTDVVALNGCSEAEVLRIAATLEQRSSHPIAGAILRKAGSQVLPEPDHFHSTTGRGITGTVDGQEFKVGTAELLNHAVPDPVALLSAKGRTAVYVGTDSELVGAIIIADSVREGAREAVRDLRKQGIERVVMLTGDNSATAQAIADEVGLDEYRAQLLPEDKVAAVKELAKTYGPVAMVGDGINDAPALATAAVGIAMGAAGSDTALETADAALMSDDLSKLPYLFRLSRSSSRVIKQNIWASILIKFSLAAGVIPGLVSLAVAVLVGDMGTSLGVTTNAMRLARVKAD
jgi:Cd2+/Zn2+-exporting ATPase